MFNLNYSEEARNEYKQIKKQMILDRQKKVEIIEEKKESENVAVAAFLQEKEKYKESSSKISKKGANREEQVSFVSRL